MCANFNVIQFINLVIVISGNYFESWNKYCYGPYVPNSHTRINFLPQKFPLEFILSDMNKYLKSVFLCNLLANDFQKKLHFRRCIICLMIW